MKSFVLPSGSRPAAREIELELLDSDMLMLAAAVVVPWVSRTSATAIALPNVFSTAGGVRGGGGRARGGGLGEGGDSADCSEFDLALGTT